MAFTEITTQGWGQRVGGSLKGTLFGIVLFLAGFPVLFFNEGRAVKTAKSLKEGAATVVSASASDLSPANEGKLVHISGLVETADVLRDPVFGVRTPALKLARIVEMYQWQEESESRTREKAGGGSETTTVYTYEPVWSSNLINSNQFREGGYENPPRMPFESATQLAPKATMGDFHIPPRLLQRMTPANSLPIAEGAFTAPATTAPKLDNGGLYLGADPAKPRVGDTRISFEVVYPAVASVIAKQVGSTLEPYPTRAGRDLDMLEMGQVDAKSMFATAVANNKALTWAVRFLGALLMFIGLTLLFQPLVMVARFIPFLGSLLNVGTGLFAALIAIACATVTVAISWIVFRPLMGVLLLAAAVGVVVLIYKLPGRIKLDGQGGLSANG
jgi:hypothetical protein